MKELTNLEDQPSTESEYVILSIGINDRENIPISRYMPNLRKMAAKANHTFPQAIIAIPQIYIADHLSNPINTIQNNSMTAYIRYRTSPHYLSLTANSFETAYNDIHWTKRKANTLLAHWLTHINC